MRPNPYRRDQVEAREADIVRMRSEGQTLQQIGDKLGISRQFVHQLHRRALAKAKAKKLADCLDSPKEGA